MVEAVGGGITRFKPGDEVFGVGAGSLAEYATAAEDALAAKPAGVSFEQAAAVPVAGLTALQGLRNKGRVQPGQQVLVNGASGGVGTFAVQLATSLGAQVTGVCSTRNLDLVGSLGADQVVDYTKEDFTRSDRRDDLPLDVAGSRSWAACRQVLHPRATLVLVGAPRAAAWPDRWGTSSASGWRRCGPASGWSSSSPRRAPRDLEVLGELLETGAVTPVVERRYPLDQAADALRYLGAGHAQGKLVVVV